MKQLLLILLVLAGWLIPAGRLRADSLQTRQLRLIYLGAGPSYQPATDKVAGHLSLDFVLGNQWGWSGGIDLFIQKAKETPGDYYPSVFDFLVPGNNEPHDRGQAYRLTATRTFPTRFKRLRFGLEAGAALVVLDRAHFTPIQNPGLFSGNYSIRYSTELAPGAYVKAKTEFPFLRALGLGVHGYLNFNGAAAYGGIGINVLVGKIRESLDYEPK